MSYIYIYIDSTPKNNNIIMRSSCRFTVYKGVVNKGFHEIIGFDDSRHAAKMIYLNMNPGDTVFFHPLLIHGSGPNVTKVCTQYI